MTFLTQCVWWYVLRLADQIDADQGDVDMQSLLVSSITSDTWQSNDSIGVHTPLGSAAAQIFPPRHTPRTECTTGGEGERGLEYELCAARDANGALEAKVAGLQEQVTSLEQQLWSSNLQVSSALGAQVC